MLSLNSSGRSSYCGLNRLATTHERDQPTNDVTTQYHYSLHYVSEVRKNFKKNLKTKFFSYCIVFI